MQACVGVVQVLLENGWIYLLMTWYGPQMAACNGSVLVSNMVLDKEVMASKKIKDLLGYMPLQL